MCKISSHVTRQLDMFINVEFYAEPCRFCPMRIDSYKHVADRLTFTCFIHPKHEDTLCIAMGQHNLMHEEESFTGQCVRPCRCEDNALSSRDRRYPLETQKTVVLPLILWFVDAVLFTDSLVVLMNAIARYPSVPRKHMHWILHSIILSSCDCVCVCACAHARLVV